MTDPLEPFRAEFLRLQEQAERWLKQRRALRGFKRSFRIERSRSYVWWGAWTISAAGVVDVYEYLPAHAPLFKMHSKGLYPAAKALQIAETQGPDAALLWKLST